MTTKHKNIFPPHPPSCPLLRDAIASLTKKIDQGLIDQIVERQFAHRVRRIEATLDRSRELRLYGGQR
jgi:hypothetical protein